ncbi:hypothetical protein [Devosia sp. RR2S18]|uniref:hypothetical protein n=1 Tax=Devosia rhizosphaerae TaxID=3049774 RepID=UPI00254066FC|nr:hypothetical protein [Devosia sp. RR2S18]WIJ23427.1 hypothetical protein QOV41_10025 [Devosia sp. RR2S18]
MNIIAFDEALPPRQPHWDAEQWLDAVRHAAAWHIQECVFSLEDASLFVAYGASVVMDWKSSTEYQDWLIDQVIGWQQ